MHGHQTDMCLKEIGVHVENKINILGRMRIFHFANKTVNDMSSGNYEANG